MGIYRKEQVYILCTCNPLIMTVVSLFGIGIWEFQLLKMGWSTQSDVSRLHKMRLDLARLVSPSKRS